MGSILTHSPIYNLTMMKHVIFIDGSLRIKGMSSRKPRKRETRGRMRKHKEGNKDSCKASSHSDSNSNKNQRTLIANKGPFNPFLS